MPAEFDVEAVIDQIADNMSRARNKATCLHHTLPPLVVERVEFDNPAVLLPEFIVRDRCHLDSTAKPDEGNGAVRPAADLVQAIGQEREARRGSVEPGQEVRNLRCALLSRHALRRSRTWGLAFASHFRPFSAVSPW